MEYRYIATSVSGFVRQLAVGYVTHGHLFYVTGEIPPHKDPAAVDAKLLARYEIAISKWARYRRRKAGQASVHYLRHGRFFVLIASHGRHRFFEEERGNIQDIRRRPLRFAGYTISYRKGVDRKWHASVRIAPEEYRAMKARFLRMATRRTAEQLAEEFRQIPFEPYAPVRRQVLCVWRAVRRVRDIQRLSQRRTNHMPSQRQVCTLSF